MIKKSIAKNYLVFLTSAISSTHGHTRGPTGEDIYGNIEGGGSDFGIFECLILIAFYGPFIFSLLKDKSTRRMIFFLVGTIGSLIYISTSLGKDDGLFFVIVFLVFWIIAGDRITAKIMGDDKPESNTQSNGIKSNTISKIHSEGISNVNQLKQQPASVNISKIEPHLKSVTIHTDKSVQTKSISDSSTFPIISGQGWKYDKRARVLWNPSTKEILTNWDGLGYSVNDIYLTLHNKVTPRKIPKNEVEEADFDWTQPYQ